MRYLVISACEDVRTGKEFEAGDEFLPEPDQLQADRLLNAGCLRPIPDNAPALPGTDETAQIITGLQAELDRARADAGVQIAALNDRLGEVTAQHGNLLSEYQAARSQFDAVSAENTELRGERDRLAARVAEVEGQLDDATRPVADQPAAEQASDPAPAKPAKKN